jgi:dTDP-glucose 4,6-dehydratase
VLHKGRNGEVYNVGGRNERNNLQVVRTILEELGKPESLISYVKDRLGHDRRYAIDADKIRNELGWQPKFNYEDGIKETIRWYLSNKEWMEQVTSGSYQQYYDTQYKDRLEANESHA